MRIEGKVLIYTKATRMIAAVAFVEFIARDQQERLVADLTRFSLQADGSTDTGNIKEKLFLVLYVDQRGKYTQLITKRQLTGWETNANIGGRGGLKRHLKDAVPWVVFFGVWPTAL